MDIEYLKKLVEKINKASYAYYSEDNPTISDKEWDALYDELLKIEKETGVVLPDSPSRKVGGEIISEFQKHTHLAPLYSLEKVQSKEELLSWFKKQDDDNTYSLEYKFDGLSLNLTYDKGCLVQASTRGNGKIGESVLEQAKTIREIPILIPYKGKFEIQGECIMKLSVFNEYNKSADEVLKNPRNAAAGAIRNLDPKVTAARKLSIYFYEIGYIEGKEFENQREMLDFMKENRFPLSPFYYETSSKDDILSMLDKIEKERAELDFLIDGAVIKICDKYKRNSLGYTDKHPRWAIAYKFKAEEATTRLLNVSWEVGRTGKLTPIAVLEPVDFYGVTVKRATLNNSYDITRKGVYINDRVWIRRSNDVIPEILGVAERYEDSKPIEVPRICPSCGFKLVERGAHIFCENPDCKQQVIAKIAHFVSKPSMNIDGLSIKTIELLVEKNLINSFSDIYKLKAEDLISLPSFQSKKIDNLITSINKSKNCSLAAFINAIGIPNVGKVIANDLANKFKSLDNIIAASFDELISIDEIGEQIANSIFEYFRNQKNIEEIKQLLANGVSIAEEKNKNSDKLSGLNFVITGELNSLKRSEAEKLIIDNGGKVQSSVTKNTNILLAGESAGSKLEKAKSLNTKIIDEQEFLFMIG